MIACTLKKSLIYLELTMKKCYMLMKNSAIYVEKSSVMIKTVQTTKETLKLGIIVILLLTMEALLIVYAI